MTIHISILLTIIVVLVICILVGFVFAVRWNILIRRLENTRNVGALKNFNPVKLYLFMKSYEPCSKDEMRTFSSAFASFKLAMILFVIIGIIFLAVMNIEKVVQ